MGISAGDRISFQPPSVVTLHFCPACGKNMTGVAGYDIDERKSAKCHGRVHTAPSRGYVYYIASVQSPGGA